MKKPAIWACGLFLITLMLYWPGRDFEFVSDDYLYVGKNEFVQNGLSWKSIRYAFGFSISNWHPLVWLSWMLDVELNGLSPRAFRTTNYLLHSANAVLLFLWLRNLTGQDHASLFVAAVFAVHPLHVESVQWIAERKDVLSMFFGLLTLLAWQRYLQVRRYRQFVWVCLAYLASLMSKQMFVTLPILLLLLDYWPLQRIGRNHVRQNVDIDDLGPHSGECGYGESWNWYRLLSEKCWLIGIAAIFCVIAIAAQQIGGSVQSSEAFPLPVRIANAVHTYWLYLGKGLCPKNLIIHYPHPGQAILTKRIVVEFAGLIAFTVILMRQTHHRYLIVGWLWYVVSMLPVIGLVQIGDQQMADRYAYLPMVGVYWACTWWLIDATPRRWERIVRVAVGVVALAIFAGMAREQIGYWRTHMSLIGRWRDVLRDRE